MEPQDRAPPQCGTTSKTGARSVTEEQAARRGRLESRGIRKKQKTIGSQEPSVTRLLEVVQPVVRGRDRNKCPLISAPSLAYRKAESEPHFLLPSLFQKGTQTHSSPCTHRYTILTVLAGYTTPSNPLPRRLWRQKWEVHNTSKL